MKLQAKVSFSVSRSLVRCGGGFRLNSGEIRVWWHLYRMLKRIVHYVHAFRGGDIQHR